MNECEQLIDEIIRTELKKYRFFYSDNEKIMIKNGNFLDLVTEQLEKMKLFSWLFATLLLLFSGATVLLLIHFGRTESMLFLLLGILTWITAIALTYLLAKEIVARRQSMHMIIQLLNRSTS